MEAWLSGSNRPVDDLTGDYHSENDKIKSKSPGIESGASALGVTPPSGVVGSNPPLSE